MNINLHVFILWQLLDCLAHNDQIDLCVYRLDKWNNAVVKMLSLHDLEMQIFTAHSIVPCSGNERLCCFMLSSFRFPSQGEAWFPCFQICWGKQEGMSWIVHRLYKLIPRNDIHLLTYHWPKQDPSSCLSPEGMEDSVDSKLALSVRMWRWWTKRNCRI